MENPILEAKKNLIQWISNLDDLEALSELMEVKTKHRSADVFADAQTEYEIKDDFDERFAKGISHQEMKRRTIEHIRNLPWK